MRLSVALAALSAISIPARAGNSRRAALRRVARSLPDCDPQEAQAVADAALEEETVRVPAELILSVAWGESRFKPHERTGIVCGVMQVAPVYMGLPYEKTCRLWERDVTSAVFSGVLELEEDLDDPRVNGDIRRALMYRACGNSYFSGTCQKTGAADWILRRARRIERLERSSEPRLPPS